MKGKRIPRLAPALLAGVALLAVGGVALLLVRRKGPPDQPCP